MQYGFKVVQKHKFARPYQLKNELTSKEIQEECHEVTNEIVADNPSSQNLYVPAPSTSSTLIQPSLHPLFRFIHLCTSLTGNFDDTDLPSPRKIINQLRLTTSTMGVSEKQIETFDSTLVRMIALDFQPMSIVEDEGFNT